MSGRQVLCELGQREYFRFRQRTGSSFFSLLYWAGDWIWDLEIITGLGFMFCKLVS
ncbi:hypothetical protein Fmac_005625 [Flemingia macrophylla]|uniref:Uncharacterized protein n=1 Tax=Flemingia macrophylla TaxID=520843 RepID=A0ABD1N897_9FABA